MSDGTGGTGHAPARVTVVGETLVDLLWRRGADQVVPVPGGSPANVAVGLHRLGRPVSLVTTWGDDLPGELVARHLAGTGVDVRRAPAASGRTMVALAYLDDQGAASYDFLAAWDPRELPVPSDTAVLHTGSLAVVVEPGASRVYECCRRLRERPGGDGVVVVDLNVRPAVRPDRAAYRAACAELAAVTDVVKASDEDLRWLFPDRDVAQAAAEVLAWGPRAVVVTLGGEGAMAVSAAGTRVSVAAPSVTVADTVGAGDTFQAALLDAVASRVAAGEPVLPEEPERLAGVLRRCAAAAAVNCTRVGADPPTSRELAAALAAWPTPHGAGAAPGEAMRR